jgi:hypothetical protein
MLLAAHLHEEGLNEVPLFDFTHGPEDRVS